MPNFASLIRYIVAGILLNSSLVVDAAEPADKNAKSIAHLLSSGKRCLPQVVKSLPSFNNEPTSEGVCLVRVTIKGSADEVKKFYADYLTANRWNVAISTSDGSIFRFTAAKHKKLVGFEFSQISKENTQIELSFTGDQLK